MTVSLEGPKRGRLKPSVQATVDSLTARHGIIARLLGRALGSVEPSESHYAKQVSGLVDTLVRHRRNQDSFHSFRAAIGQIVLRPDEEGTTLLVDIEGGPFKRSHKPKMVKQPPTEMRAEHGDHSHAVYFGLNARYRDNSVR